MRQLVFIILIIVSVSCVAELKNENMQSVSLSNITQRLDDLLEKDEHYFSQKKHRLKLARSLLKYTQEVDHLLPRNNASDDAWVRKKMQQMKKLASTNKQASKKDVEFFSSSKFTKYKLHDDLETLIAMLKVVKFSDVKPDIERVGWAHICNELSSETATFDRQLSLLVKHKKINVSSLSKQQILCQYGRCFSMYKMVEETIFYKLFLPLFSNSDSSMKFMSRVFMNKLAAHRQLLY